MASFKPNTQTRNKLQIGGLLALNEAHDFMFKTKLQKENFIRGMFSNKLIASHTQGRGKSVKVTRPVLKGDVSIQDYTVYVGVPKSDKFTYDYEEYTIENHKAINVEMDNIELQLAEPEFYLNVTREVATQTADFFEAEAVKALLNGGTILTNKVPTTATTIYSDILDTVQFARENNKKTDNMILLVTPATHKLLKKSTEITSIINSTSDDIYNELRKRGVMEMVDGLPIMITNALIGKDVDFMLVDFNDCEDLSLINGDGSVKLRNVSESNKWDASFLSGRFVYDFLITQPLGVLIKKNK